MLWGFPKSLSQISQIVIILNSTIVCDGIFKIIMKYNFKICSNDFWNPHIISSENDKIHKNKKFSIIFDNVFWNPYIISSQTNKVHKNSNFYFFRQCFWNPHIILSQNNRIQKNSNFGKFFNNDFWNLHIISSQNDRIHKNWTWIPKKN